MNRVLLGILTPSSNTQLEPLTVRMLDGLPEVSAHFSRFRVVDVGLEASAQFDLDPILAAADLLADARVDAIAWSGTSGGWRGIEHDQRLCDLIKQRTGIPATTSTLALLEAAADDRAVGLVTPYPDDLHDVVVNTLTTAGLAITGARNHFVTKSNWELSNIPAQAIGALVAELAADGADAVAVYCTNLAAGPDAATWEESYGVRVYDSVALAVWGALRLAGADTSRVTGWGSLFRALTRPHRTSTSRRPTSKECWRMNGAVARNKDIQVLIGVDVDAVAGWLGSYGGGDSPSDIQRGIFAGEVGSPRLLKLLNEQAIKSTWFIPGHSLETFPEQMAAVAEAGHEIGAHGYSHENPIELSEDQERAVMARSVELITKLTGSAPLGYVAPWWETSERGALLLKEFGFSYGHSQNYHDFLPFYARVGDTWVNPDYSQPAETWMRPLQRGRTVDIVEFCGNWYLDDLPPMMWIKQSPNSHGFVNPRDIEQMWRDQFDWVYREMDYAVLPITLHPDVSGRPQVLLMLERLFGYLREHAGVSFQTFEYAAADFRRRFPYPGRLGSAPAKRCGTGGGVSGFRSA